MRQCEEKPFGDKGEFDSVDLEREIGDAEKREMDRGQGH